MSRGLGKIERAILEVMPDDGSPILKTMVSRKVAGQMPGVISRLNDQLYESMAIEDQTEQDIALQLLQIANTIHRKKDPTLNKFSASFSRALRSLERKGLISRYPPGYRTTYISKRVEGEPPRWSGM